MATDTKTPALLTPDEAAEELRISRSSFYRLVRGGEVPALRLAGPRSSIRIRRDALERWTVSRQNASHERDQAARQAGEKARADHPAVEVCPSAFGVIADD